MAGRGMLLGRAELVARVCGHLDVIGERGCSVGLTGEAGVGKSALQAAVVEEARARGLTVLWARGSESETHLPFASLHQALRPVLARAENLAGRQREALLSGFGMSDVAASDPFLVALAALELVTEEARRAPVLLSLDDLQWMDEPSVEVFSFIARRVEGEPVMVLGSARTGSAPLADDPAIEWIPVPGLDPRSASELVVDRAPDLAPALRDRVLREAAGNPLALLEFPVAMASGRFGWTELAGDLPMTTRLERAFVSRVGHLPAPARSLLAVAALDDGAELAEMLAAAGVLAGGVPDHPDHPADPDSLRPALEAGLLVSDGVSVEFRHPLVRSALRHSMPSAQRRAVHGALAGVLADSHPERAAWHRASSTTAPDESVAAELEVAARSVARRGALTSAVTWLQRAAALSPDDALRGARLISAAEIAYELGRHRQVEEIKRQVARPALRPRDRARLVWLDGAFDDGSSADPAEVRRLVALAGAALRDDDRGLALQLLLGAARRAWWGEPGRDVRHEIVVAARSASLPDDDPALLSVLALTESTEHATAVVRRLGRWSADGDPGPEAAALLGIAAFCVGDFARASAFLAAPIDELRAQGRLSVLAEALTISAWSAIYQGSFDLARCADEAVRLADGTGRSLWAATARAAIAALDAVHGAPADASLLTEAERVGYGAATPMSTTLAAVQLARGLQALAAGRHEEAFGHLRRVFDPADPVHHRVQNIWTLGYLVEAAVPVGRATEARLLLAEMEEVAGADPAPATLVALEYSRAVLAGEDDGDAGGLFEQALGGAGSRQPWHRARVELAYGAWLRRRRRVVESRVQLRAARDTFEALGTPAWADRADQELRATGERGTRPGALRPERLSAQEAEIAHLAAEGLSNREIGQRLYLSHRTVGSHLYRIFPKLGVSSRGQLGAVLAGNRMPSPG